MVDTELSPGAAAAVDYVGHGFAVIPLRPESKEPATTHGRDDWSDDPQSVARQFTAVERSLQANAVAYEGHWCNVGIVCGQPSRNLLVIDVDRHEGGADGFATLAEWEREHGPLPETVTSITGGGGKQLFYLVDRVVTGRANSALGVDLRYNNYVVAPPSVHPDTGEAYEWSVSPDDMDVARADANVDAFVDHLLDWAGGSSSAGASGDYEPPESLGHGERNDGLFRYGCHLRGRGADDATVCEELDRANREVCETPLGDRELATIKRSVCRLPVGMSEEAKERARGSKTGEVVRFEKREEEPAKDDGASTTTAPGKSVAAVTLEIMDGHQGICDGLRYNEDDMLPYVTEPFIGTAPFVRPHPITDEEEAMLFMMVENMGGTSNMSTFRTVMKAYLGMDRHRYSPMAEAMALLPLVRSKSGAPIAEATDIEYSEDHGQTWQDAPLESVRGMLFPSFLGVECNRYNTEVERLISRGIVARALHPGCKFDYMPIFLGNQGTGKSTVIRKLALCDEFAIEGFNRFDDEGVKRLEGKLVAEVGELSAFNSADMDSIKDFVTRVKDTYRKSYGRYAVTVPRRCILMGTSNKQSVLDDSTGNRRFVIVECGGEMNRANPGIFDGTLDQCVRVWLAQSMAERTEVGEGEFLKLLRLPTDVLDTARATQDSHSFEDETANAVREYLDSLPGHVDRVNVRMVMMEGMGYRRKDFMETKKWVRASVADAVAACGWVPERGKQLVKNEAGVSFGTSRSWRRP